MYDASILTVHGVIKLLRFTTSDNTNNERHVRTREMLQLRIIRYLLGKGHVRGGFLDATVPEDLRGTEKDSDSFRCKLFLRAITDSTLLPTGTLPLTVSIHLGIQRARKSVLITLSDSHISSKISCARTSWESASDSQTEGL